MAKPFASSADMTAKTETLEILGDGVYALTAQGDPNVGAIEGEDFIVAIEARATPAAARDWLRTLRAHTQKPIKYLVLTHYHAVRVLGASAFEAEHIISSDVTRQLIEERGEQDWASEYGRMPRLFKEFEGIPGLTRPTQTFATRHEIALGGERGTLEPAVQRPGAYGGRHRRLARQEQNPVCGRSGGGRSGLVHGRCPPL